MTACAGASDSGAPAGVSACTTCAATNDHSFSYTASLHADRVPVAAGQDVVVRWDSLTEDVHGHPRGSFFAVEEALLLAFQDTSPAEVEEALAQDALTQAQVGLFATCTPRDNACRLSDFSVFGRTFELETYFLEGSATWLVLLQSSAEAGGHAFVFLEPQDDATATEVSVTDDTSALLVDADLGSARALVPEVDDSTVLSWGDITRDGLGQPLIPHQLDRLVVGRYPDLDVSGVESKVFDLERLATPLWEAQVSDRTEVTLGELAAGGALPQPGQGTTLLAVYCTACLNPAPKLVVRLETP